MASIQKPVLVLDFDDTITQGDTIGLLIDAAINAQTRETEPEGQQERLDALRALKDRLVAEYVEAFQVLVERHLPQQGLARERGLDMEIASGFLDDMNDFEQRMNTKVAESSILSGIQEADLAAAADGAVVRPHVRETINTALRRGWHVHVLSVNWSAVLICEVLRGIPCQIAVEQEELAEQATASPSVTIHANNLDMQLGMSTGALVGNIQGPMDKANVLEDILLSLAAACGDGSAPCIYVGDSIGDLAALLAAHFPIVLGENAMLRHALNVFGCTLHAIGTADLSANAPHPAGHLYATESWAQIHEFLFQAEPGNVDLLHATSPTTPSLQDSLRILPSERSTATGDAVPESARGDRAAAHGNAGPPRVLIVAGSDSGGGAGVQADIKTCMACGAHGSTAITALTVQNSHGVSGVHIPPDDFLTQQMAAVLDDIGADVLKTGMLPGAASVRAVAKQLHACPSGRRPLCVVDPVMVSSSGHSLAASEVCEALKEHLLPLATVLTPNVIEAAALLGEHASQVVHEYE